MNNSQQAEALLSPSFSLKNRWARFAWTLVYCILFRPTPRPLHAWRAWLLKQFGAQLGPKCHIYPKAIIWAPWNLTCGTVVAIADGAEIYNPSPITIGDFAVVSQGAYLCGASHDYKLTSFPLISDSIRIGPSAWIAARAILQMGVTIGEGCVIGAGSVVTKDMPAWTVCAGNPCRPIKPYEKSHD